MIGKTSVGKTAVVVLSALLVVSCSSDDQADSVSDQKSNAETAVNAAPHNPARTHSTNKNPFATKPVSAQAKSADSGALTDQSESAQAPVSSQPSYAVSSSEEYQPSPNKVVLSPVSEDYVEWSPPTEVAYKQVDVMISAPNGKMIKRTFGPGETMVLDQALPDGIYSWESVVTPDINPYVHDEMRRIRELGDLQAEQELIAQLRASGDLPSEEQGNDNRRSGTFIVQDGKVRPSQIDGPTNEQPGRGS